MNSFFPRVYHPASGRVLEVSTSQSGVQFYTANFLDGSLQGKDGAAYAKHCSFCLETQSWPDAVNKVQQGARGLGVRGTLQFSHMLSVEAHLEERNYRSFSPGYYNLISLIY